MSFTHGWTFAPPQRPHLTPSLPPYTLTLVTLLYIHSLSHLPLLYSIFFLSGLSLLALSVGPFNLRWGQVVHRSYYPPPTLTPSRGGMRQRAQEQQGERGTGRRRSEKDAVKKCHHQLWTNQQTGKFHLKKHVWFFFYFKIHETGHLEGWFWPVHRMFDTPGLKHYDIDLSLYVYLVLDS